MTALDVRPADPDRWDDVVTVMGTRGDPSRCWCQFFHRRGQDWETATTASNRERLCGQIADARVPPGVLAYDGDEPVGWCQVAPKADFARLLHSPSSAPPRDEPDPPELWAVTCFVVPPRRRRRGVAAELLAGAVEHADAHDANAVEGYPVDAVARASVSSAELYHGTLTLFLAAGFHEVRRPSPTRVVVRRSLA
jgi:GNAT superfamily N-acetyltransferase